MDEESKLRREVRQDYRIIDFRSEELLVSDLARASVFFKRHFECTEMYFRICTKHGPHPPNAIITFHLE